MLTKGNVMRGAALFGSIAAAVGEVHAQQPTDSTAVHRLSGCYRLTLGRWSGPLPATGFPAAHTPPAQFRLDTARLAEPFSFGYAVDPRELLRRRRVRPAFWILLRSDSLAVVWSTGFLGVRLDLVAHGDTLVGQARTLHDAHADGEPPDPEAAVRAVRVDCGRVLHAPTLQPDTTPLRRQVMVGEFPDDTFAEIAGRIPGFAGILFSGDTLVLMLVDASRRTEAEAAVQPIVSGRRYRHVTVRRAQYDFRQLRDWKDQARRTAIRGWTMLDADEARNRIVVGVIDSTYVVPARRALEAAGIPSAAIIVEVKGRAIPLGAVRRK